MLILSFDFYFDLDRRKTGELAVAVVDDGSTDLGLVVVWSNELDFVIVITWCWDGAANDIHSVLILVVDQKVFDSFLDVNWVENSDHLLPHV